MSDEQQPPPREPETGEERIARETAETAAKKKRSYLEVLKAIKRDGVFWPSGQR